MLQEMTPSSCCEGKKLSIEFIYNMMFANILTITGTKWTGTPLFYQSHQLVVSLTCILMSYPLGELYGIKVISYVSAS